MTSIVFQNLALWPYLIFLALPVLIHLRARRLHSVEQLPTLHILQRSIGSNLVSPRLKRILLMILRMLLVFFMVAAFLKPIIPAPLTVRNGTFTARIVIMDVSQSMSYRTGGISTFEQAQAAADTLFSDLQTGDTANLLLAGDTPYPVFPKLSNNFIELQNRVRESAPVAERCDIKSALKMAYDMLQNSRSLNKEIALVSDFQNTDVTANLFSDTPPEIKLALVPVADSFRRNRAITALSISPDLPAPNTSIHISAQVWNGTSSQQTIPITFTVARKSKEGALFTNTSAQNAAAEVSPYSFAIADTKTILPDASNFQITAQIPQDGLTADDFRSIDVDLNRKVKALLVVNGYSKPESAAWYLKRALSPFPGSAGRVKLSVRQLQQLNVADIKGFDIILMDIAAPISASDLWPLIQSVQNGGNCILFLSGSSAQSTLAKLEKRLDGQEHLPFLPGAVRDLRNSSNSYLTIAEQNHDRLHFRKVEESNWSGLRSVHFRNRLEVREVENRSERLINFADGTPAVVRGRLGKGSLILCNFSPGRDSGDLARSPIFPPLIHEMIASMEAGNGFHQTEHSMDASESDLRSVDLQHLKLSSNVSVLNHSAAPLRSRLSQLHTDSQLWPICILAVIALLLGEDILSSRKTKSVSAS